MSRFVEAIKALKRALACSASDGEKVTKGRRVELLFRLATLYDETMDRKEAIQYLELCLDEAWEGDTSSSSAETREALAMPIVPRAQLLLAQWALEDGDSEKARYLATRIKQHTELGREAQDLLSRCRPP
jgi:hypothetical protein